MHPSRPRTALTKRLLFPFAAILILTWLGSAVFTKKAAFRESRAFLAGEASAVLQTLLDVSVSAAAGQHLKVGDGRVLMVWRSGELVFSRNAMDRARPSGLSSKVELVGDDNWLIATDCAGDICALVGIRDTERKMAIRRLVAVIYLPLLALLGLGLAAATFAVRRALKPIEGVSENVRSMEIDRLERLDLHGIDRELEPLVTAINHLMARVRTQLEQERSFLGLYAHEIRTPIAGLNAQMQLLREEITVPSQTFENVLNCSARTVRVANQLLALARSKNVVAMPRTGVELNFTEQLRNTMAEVGSLNSGVDMTLTADADLWIAIDPFVVDVIVRNLLDNAVHYGRPRTGNSRIVVTCTVLQKTMRLDVEDNGEGLSADQIELAILAFQRVPSTENPLGTGLGLSIVVQMVEGLGGHLILDRSPELGGLRARIVLPLGLLQTI